MRLLINVLCSIKYFLKGFRMKSEIEADIKFLKQMAEQGQKSPLQGGEHGVLWGGMFTVSALFAYAVVAQIIALPSWTIALAFIGPAPIGLLVGQYLNKKYGGSSGGFSFGNKTSAAAWGAVGITIGALYLPVLAAQAMGFLSLNGVYIFGSLQVTVFALYAVAYATTAQVSGAPRQYLFSGTAIAASVASVFTMGTLDMFLVMAAGLFCSAVIPGYLTRSKQSVAV